MSEAGGGMQALIAPRENGNPGATATPELSFTRRRRESRVACLTRY